MKTVYIPKGETVSYETLSTEHLIVEGCLNVSRDLNAKTISGKGVIHAGKISADDICSGVLEAAAIICKRLVAKQVEAPEVFASESAAVSSFLSAAYVETGKLTVTVSEIGEVKAGKVVNLTPKKRSLLGLLLASALRSFWVSLTIRKPRDKKTETVPPQGAAEPAAMDDEKPEASAPDLKVVVPEWENETADVELNRIVNLFKLSREQGYTLRLIPGTPEENAPVFNFDTERIERPAA